MSFSPIVRGSAVTFAVLPSAELLLLRLLSALTSRMRDKLLCLGIAPLLRASSPAGATTSVRHNVPTASRCHQRLSPVLPNAISAIKVGADPKLSAASL